MEISAPYFLTCHSGYKEPIFSQILGWRIKMLNIRKIITSLTFNHNVHVSLELCKNYLAMLRAVLQ